MPTHSILINAGLAAFGRVASLAAGLIATAVLARLLGPATYGTYLLVISYATILQLVADSGLYLTMTKEIARHPAAAQLLLSHAAAVRLSLLALAAGIGTALASALPSLRGALPVYLLVVGGLTAQSLSQLLMGVFQHQQVVWRAVVGDLGARAVHLVLLGGLVAVRAVTLITAAAALAISLLAGFVIHQALAPQRITTLSFERRIWSRLLRASWPLGALLILNALYFKTDLLIISLFRAPAEVGQYGAAFRLVESALFFPAMLGGLLLPRITEAVGRPVHVSRLLSEGVLVAGTGGLLLLVVLSLKASPIISLIAGSQYTAAATLLRILGIALALMFVGNIFGYALVALERQRDLLRLYVVLVGVNALANLVVVPRFGAAGAALVTVGVEALSASVAALLVMRHIPLQLPATALLPAAATIAAAALPLLLAPSSIPLLVQCTTAAVAAALAAHVTRLMAAVPTLTTRSPSPLAVSRPEEIWPV